MRYLPINLDVRDKPAVVVGGGPVAFRKCLALLAGGARVTVIAPFLDRSFGEVCANGSVCHVARAYVPGDLAGAFLVFAATDSPAVNRAVADEARSREILADIADAPGNGSFTLPAVMRRGELLIAVSTGGNSPALARLIRSQLETLYGPEYGAALELLGSLREKLLTDKVNSAYNKEIFNVLAEQLPPLIKDGAIAEIDNLLTKLLGPDATLARLGSRGKDHQ